MGSLAITHPSPLVPSSTFSRMSSKWNRTNVALWVLITQPLISKSHACCCTYGYSFLCIAECNKHSWGVYWSFRYRSIRYSYETSWFSSSEKGNLEFSALRWQTRQRAQWQWGEQAWCRRGPQWCLETRRPPCISACHCDQPGMEWPCRRPLTTHTSATADRKGGMAPRATKIYISLMVSETALFLLHHFHQLKIYAKNFCSGPAEWRIG